MQLSRIAPLLALLSPVLAASPARAGICTLIVATPGVLAMSSSGTQLGSEELGGVSAIMTVGSIGASTLTVDAPTVTQSPAGYNQGGQVVEVSYRGDGVLSSAVQAYTASQTQVAVPNLINAVTFTIDNRVTNSAGFPAGTYQTRTVVTCS
jgi:hypothetical protein